MADKLQDEGIDGTYILCVGIIISLALMAAGIKNEIVSAKQEIIQAIHHGEASR